MAKRRPSGDGMVRKREDGRWEGRIVVGHKKNGTPIFQHAYAHTQKELTEKRVALGHKPDDHEPEQQQGFSMKFHM